MTRKRIPKRRQGANNPEDPTQGDRILTALGRWLDAQPGRSFRVARTPDGWSAELTERQAATGTTMLDAAAQIAVAATFATPGPDEGVS